MTAAGDNLDRIERWALHSTDEGEIAIAAYADDVLALVEIARAAQAVTDKQQECLENLRSHGVVFDDIGNDPTNWQHVAFTIYTDFCEAESVTRAALARLNTKEGA